MNETERKVYLEQFNRRTHVLGRAVCVITLVLLVGAPFLIGTFLGAMPDMGAVGKGFRIIANEVRNLATQTGSFAKEIETNVGEFRATVDRARMMPNPNGAMLSHIAGQARGLLAR